MIRAVVLVLSVAGCGRWGFNVSPGGQDALSLDAGPCAVRATPSSVTISGTTIIVEDFMQIWKAAETMLARPLDPLTLFADEEPVQ